eukprot:9429192-Pyramimonas_sp.AAC.1
MRKCPATTERSFLSYVIVGETERGSGGRMGDKVEGAGWKGWGGRAARGIGRGGIGPSSVRLLLPLLLFLLLA